MAWTTPRTWVAGEVVTAALMNLHVKDNLDVLKTHEEGQTAQHGLGTGVYFVGAKQEKLRLERKEGDVTIVGTVGEVKSVSITWDNAFSTIRIVLATTYYTTTASMENLGVHHTYVSARSTTGATLTMASAYGGKAATYTISALGIGV
jgi:voltage-gated potassium channel Kch